jgi:hypothetical protein
MKQGSTLFLRAAVSALGVAALAVCVFVLPTGIRVEDADGYRPILIGLYAPAIPFFIALYQAMLLLEYIDKNEAFSQLSVKALNSIKYCGIAIAAMFAAGMPYIFIAADRDDAPGVVALGLVIGGASTVIAVFAALLQKLLQNAIEIKSENDLTV